MVGGDEYPAIEVSVEGSSESDESQLTFSWEILSLDTKQMEF